MSMLKMVTTHGLIVFLAVAFGWDNVLGNLQKRFAEALIDWSEYLKRLKAAMDAPAKKPL